MPRQGIIQSSLRRMGWRIGEGIVNFITLCYDKENEEKIKDVF